MYSKALYRFRREGFTALELLLALAVAVPIVLGLASLTVAVYRGSGEERVLVAFTLPGVSASSAVVSRRPSAVVETDAIAYHSALTSVIRRASACYVFGAQPENYSPTSSTASAIMAIGTLRLNGWIDLGTSNQDRLSRELLTSYPALGATNVYDGSGNFSLIVVGPRASGGMGVTAVAQVIMVPASLPTNATSPLEPSLLVWARLWTVDRYWEYSWIAPAANALNAQWAPKAIQYWAWVDETRSVYEPGPILCTFPDPVSAADSRVGLSRFTYRL